MQSADTNGKKSFLGPESSTPAKDVMYTFISVAPSSGVPKAIKRRIVTRADTDRKKFCMRPECSTPAKEGGLCKFHGGGVRCGHPGCSKSAQEGRLCIAHGGGRRCKQAGCTKLAKKGGMCIAHGGGKRCFSPLCERSAQARGLCKTHGGGSTCKMLHCTKFAQSHGLCSGHGGGKRCRERGCRKLAQSSNGTHCLIHDKKKSFKSEEMVQDSCTQMRQVSIKVEDPGLVVGPSQSEQGKSAHPCIGPSQEQHNSSKETNETKLAWLLNLEVDEDDLILSV